MTLPMDDAEQQQKRDELIVFEDYLNHPHTKRRQAQMEQGLTLLQDMILNTVPDSIDKMFELSFVLGKYHILKQQVGVDAQCHEELKTKLKG